MLAVNFFLTSTLAEIKQRVVSPSRVGLQLIPAQLGNQAGMLGAAKLIWNEIEKQRIKS